MAVRVLIVDAKPARSQRLESALREAGFDVLMTVDETDDLSARMEAQEPDAVIVDADLPSRDTLENLGQLGRRYPKPVIMLAENEVPDMARDAARAGVSAYVVDGVAPSVIRSLVDVAIGHFQAHHQLRNELKRTQQTLAERKAVDRAKCLLMERHGVGEEAAYGRLRKIAMDRRLSLSAVARELLDDGR
ncbi:MAG: ANTAR domain-containing protein [Halofilum sp. (in: g-proteobacteria)]